MPVGMFRKIAILILVTGIVFQFGNCKAGDEETDESGYLLAALSQHISPGTSYLGSTARYSCVSSQLLSGYCDTQEVSETEILTGVPENIQLTMIQSDNLIQVNLQLNLSHIVSGSYLYSTTFMMTTEPTEDGKRTLRMTDSVSNIAADSSNQLFINIKYLDLLEDGDTLKGNMEIEYFRTDMTETLTSRYTVSVRKNL